MRCVASGSPSWSARRCRNLVLTSRPSTPVARHQLDRDLRQHWLKQGDPILGEALSLVVRRGDCGCRFVKLTEAALYHVPGLVIRIYNPCRIMTNVADGIDTDVDIYRTDVTIIHDVFFIPYCIIGMTTVAVVASWSEPIRNAIVVGAIVDRELNIYLMTVALVIFDGHADVPDMPSVLPCECGTSTCSRETHVPSVN